MGKGGREEREGNALKTALVVTGGLALAWLTVETAFSPFLSRLRRSMDKSDPDGDEVDAGDAAASPPPSVKKDEAEEGSGN